MAGMQVGAEVVVDDLMATVRRLPPAKLNEFARRFEAWHQRRNPVDAQDVALIQTARTRLPSADSQRFAQLIAKSEQETLTADELSEYQGLAQRAEGIDALRAQALAELVRRWRKPVDVVMSEIGWECAISAG